jgi:hypothetical protein
MGKPPRIDSMVGKNSEFWPDKYVCPKCGSQALATGIGETPSELLVGKDVLELEPEELFAALHGLGLPEDRNATAETVIPLLTEKRVVKVKGSNIPNTKRFHLDWLELEDGTRLYLAAGGYGAVIYRVRPPIRVRSDGQSSVEVQEGH